MVSFRSLKPSGFILAIALACVMALLAASGCGSKGQRSASSDTVFDMPRTPLRQPVDHDAYGELGFRIAWQGFPVMGDDARVKHFDVFDDAIVIHSESNVVTLMDASTGANRWAREVGDPIVTFVGNTMEGGELFVSSDNELFILDANTGEVIDKDDLAVVVSTPPRVVYPIVVYGSGSGEVLGHNLETGFKLWGYKLRGSITARPASLGDNLVGVVSQGGDAIIIDSRTGSSTLRARIFGGLDNDPVAGDDSMYIASLDQSIYGFSSRGSSWDWRIRTDQPLREQPWLVDEVLYVEIPDEGFAALDAAYQGERLWTNPDISGAVIGLRGGDLIVFSKSDQTVFRVDPEHGDIIAQARVNNVERMTMFPRAGGNLYAVSPRGIVSKFTPRY